MKKPRVVVGLSGGVDSTVALWLLQKQGYELIGVTLRLPVWKKKSDPGRIKAARAVCRWLAVPHQVIDCRQDFQRLVVDYFVNEFQVGQTPNPCLVCNQKLKFAKLLEFAEKEKADFVATGHYAKAVTLPRWRLTTPRKCLKMARDKSKDQSYFLAMLGQKELRRLLFPIGAYTKKQVYEIAKKQGFQASVQRQESQDFCYLAAKDKNRFLASRLASKPGPIIDQEGKVIGRHRGLHFYTCGQRHGLGLNKLHYVLRLNLKTNALIITDNKQDLFQKEVVMTNWNFISGRPPKKLIKVQAKTRSTQPRQSAVLYPASPAGKPAGKPAVRQLRLVFDQPQFAITPGQFCVFYQGDVCLGGGVISP